MTNESSKKSFPEIMIEKHGSLENAISWFKDNLAQAPIENRINYAFLLNVLGKEEESFAVSDELMAIAPNDPRILFNRGWHLIKRKKFKEGHMLLENGRSFGSYGDKSPVSQGPFFDLSRIDRSRHTMMVLEGGLGDQIIQARFANVFFKKTGHKINIAAQFQLIPVLSRLEGAGALVARKAVEGLYHEQWIPGMSAARLLVDSFDEVSGAPYLSANPHFQQKWQQIISQLQKPGKVKIGIRWAGSPNFEHQQLRKFPPEILTDLKNHPNVQLYSLQRDNDLIDLPAEVVNLGPFLKTWDDTTAALDQMDLVISSCTSVAHMSGAIGKKTWVVVPVLPYFVWAVPGDTTPWYDSVTLFRQTQFGEWGDVHERLAEALKREF